MKRHLSVLACLVLVLTFVFSLASCDVINKLLGKEPEHTHNFVDGKCECGETDPDYKPDEGGEDDKGDEGDEPAGPTTAGTAEDPHALTVPGTLNVNIAADAYVWYAFTATESKTLKVTLSSDNACMGYGLAIDEMLYTDGETSITVELEAGTKYYVAFGSLDNAAAQYTVTAAYYEKVIATPDSIAGTYYIWASGNGGYAAMEIIIGADGTITFGTTVYNYTLADNVAAVSINGNDISNIQNIIIGDDGKVAGFLHNGNEYDLYTPSDDGDDDVTDESDFILGENSVTLTDEEATAGKDFTFVAQSAGTYTFASNDLLAIIKDSTGMQIGRVEVYLQPGTYTVTLVNIAEEGGDFTLTISFTAPAGDDDEGDGSEDSPYVWNELPESVTFDSDTINKVYYLFTATQSGTITFTWPTADSWGDIFEMDGTNTTANSGDSGESTTMTFAIVAGKTYRVGLGTWAVDGEVTITISFNEGEVGGGDDDDVVEITPAGSIYADEANEITVTDAHKEAGKVYYSFMPWESGEYTFQSDDLWVSAVYLNGVKLEANDDGNYILESMEQYAVEITLTYIGVGTYTLTPAYNYPLGHQNNPNWLTVGEDTTLNFTVGSETIWYQFYANATGTLTVTNVNATPNVILYVTAVFGSEISSMTYDVELEQATYANSVSMSVIQGRKYFVGVVVNGAEEDTNVTFNASIEEAEYVGEGSENLPNAVVIGNNTANVNEGDPVYFYYRATANGTLYLTSANELCVWLIKGTDESPIAGDKSIHLEEGNIVIFNVGTSDYSTSDISFTASFKADPTQVDYEGTINLDGTANTLVIENANTFLGFQVSGATGNFTVTWDVEGAIVKVYDEVIENGANISIANPYWGPYFKVALPDFAAGTVKLTITPYVAPAQNLVLGENTITVQDTQMGDTYNLPVNADEAVTYVLTVGANAVIITNSGDIYMDAGETVEITVPAGETVSVGIGAFSWSDNVANVIVAVKGTEVEGGEGEGGEEEDPVVVIPELEIGSTQYNGVQNTYSYTASMDGVLKLTSGNAIMGPVSFSYTVNGGDAATFEVSTTVEVALSAGDVLLLTISGSGYSSITAEFYIPPTEVAGALSNLGDNEFTLTENTYVAIPLQVMGLYQITWESTDVIVEYKAAANAPAQVISSGAVASLSPMMGASLKVYFPNYAAGTVVINVAEYEDTPVNAVVGDNTVNVVDTSNGKVVNLPVSDAEVTYVVAPGNNAVVIYDYTSYFAGETVEITVAAGATVSFNVSTENFAAGEVAVNVAIKGEESEGDDEGEGETTASATGTYLSEKHGSGRYLMVEINAEAGTMTLTRSDMTGNFGTGGISVAEYTYAIADGVVTVTNVSGQVCTCVFDENGAPTSITWGSAAFTNFAKQ